MSFGSLEMLDVVKQAKYRNTFDTLVEVIKSANGSTTKAIESALNLVCEASHAVTGTFWFYSKYGDGLIHAVAQYGGSSAILNLALEPGKGIAGEVIESGKAVIVEDCSKDPRWEKKFDQKTSFVTKTMICAPLIKEDEAYGCIQLINKDDDTLFDTIDLDFVKFFSEELTKQFVSLDLLADGKDIENTAVLVANLNNFSKVARTLKPRELADLLNTFYSYCAKAVREYGGKCDTYFGNSVLFYFERTENDSNAIYNATECALKLVNNRRRLVDEFDRKYNVKFDFSIGLAYGEAFQGNIGTTMLTDHTIIGSIVTDAFDLARVAKDGAIYVTQRVTDLLESEYELKKVKEKEISCKEVIKKK